MQVAPLGIEEVNRREAPGRAAWIDLDLPEGLDVSMNLSLGSTWTPATSV